MEEPLLSSSREKHSLFPIENEDVWKLYKRALSAFWVAGEVDLSKDGEDWEKLKEEEKHFVKMVLAFFSTADGIVNENLAERFGREVTMREAKCFYDLQKTMENIHNEMYSLLIDTYISDPQEKEKLFYSVENFPFVKAKAEWAERWIRSESASFSERLVAFSVVEGVFFSGSFCAIFWMKQRGLLPGLCSSNALIARDEGMHQDFACHLYRNHILTKLAEKRVKEIVGDAVLHEKEFICGALPVDLVGMSASSMEKYIEFVADRLLQQLGHSKMYGSTCPFEFMLLQGMEAKTNFFEHRETAYKRSGADNTKGETFSFSTDTDF